MNTDAYYMKTTDEQLKDSGHLEVRHRRYLFSGGGTGGHVYPAIVVADYIRTQEPQAEILFVGVKKGAEERIVPSRNYKLLTLASQGLPKRHLFELIQFPIKVFRGVARAGGILLSYRPDVIFGTGGYASAPVVIAGILLRHLGLWKGRILLHEQNIIPGKANLWLGRLADAVALSFPETVRFFPPRKCFITGYPVRRELAAKAKDDARALLKLPMGARIVLAFGGSSGARVLNQALLGALGTLLKEHEDLYVYHAIGRPQGDYDPEKEVKEWIERLNLSETQAARYHWSTYFDHIETYYSVADLVICRAGAGTVWEVAHQGIPAILIPKARLPGDHQVKNARFLERAGLATIRYERHIYVQGKLVGEGVEPERLAAAVQRILYDEHCLRSMRERSELIGPGAADERIYRLLVRAEDRREAGLVEHQDAAQIPLAASTPIEWLSDEGLLNWLTQCWKARRRISSEDLQYVYYKADQLLHSPRWQERNLGVKIAGLSGFKERLPLLIAFITDRTPTTRLRRLLGGDFVQVGFIRRNALQALWRIGSYGPSVRRAFLFGLTDPYYEVRSWTAKALCRMWQLVGTDAELESLLRKNLYDRWFEVIVESAKALARIASDPAVLADLEVLLNHNNWKVRDAALFCIKELLSRDVLKFSPELEAQLERVQITCLDFSPHFPIRKTLEDFQKVLYERKRMSTGTLEPRLQGQES